jgi:hypothetical protein
MAPNAETPTPWQYLVELIGPGDRFEYIWLKDFPAWLSFQATYAPMTTAGTLERLLVDQQKLLRLVQQLVERVRYTEV